MIVAVLLVVAWLAPDGVWHTHSRIIKPYGKSSAAEVCAVVVEAFETPDRAAYLSQQEYEEFSNAANFRHAACVHLTAKGRDV